MCICQIVSMWICMTHSNHPLEEEDEWPKSQTWVMGEKSNRDFSGSHSHSDNQC